MFCATRKPSEVQRVQKCKARIECNLNEEKCFELCSMQMNVDESTLKLIICVMSFRTKPIKCHWRRQHVNKWHFILAAFSLLYGCMAFTWLPSSHQQKRFSYSFIISDASLHSIHYAIGIHYPLWHTERNLNKMQNIKTSISGRKNKWQQKKQKENRLSKVFWQNMRKTCHGKSFCSQ